MPKETFSDTALKGSGLTFLAIDTSFTYNYSKKAGTEIVLINGRNPRERSASGARHFRRVLCKSMLDVLHCQPQRFCNILGDWLPLRPIFHLQVD